MLWYFVFLLPLAVLVWLAYEWFEHYFVQYNSTTVECQKIKKNTEIRLCLISDLHNNRKKYSELITKLKEFRPEFVLLAGDMVDKNIKENCHAEHSKS